MAREVGELFATLGVDDAKFVAGMASAQSAMAITTATAIKVGDALTTYVSLPLAAAAIAAVKFAADAEGASSKFDVVFAGMTDEMYAWVDAFSTTFPIAEADVISMSAALQDLLVPTGMARESAATLTQEWFSLAGALAAFNDVGTEDVLEAIESALIGEYEPLRQYGISLSVAKVEAEALALGLADTTAEITDQDKQIALLSLAYKSSSDAVNGLDEQTGSLLWTWDDLIASVKDLAADFGEELLPIAQDVVGTIGDLVSGFSSLDPETKQIILKIALLAATIGPVISVGTKLGNAFSTVQNIFSKFKLTDLISGFLGLTTQTTAQAAASTVQATTAAVATAATGAQSAANTVQGTTATGAAVATTAQATATTAAGVAAGVATVPVTGLAAAVTVLTGPVGLVVGALALLGVGLAVVASSASDAADAEEDLADTTTEIDVSMASAEAAVAELTAAQNAEDESTTVLKLGFIDLLHTYEELPEAMQVIKSSLEDLDITFDDFTVENTEAVTALVDSAIGNFIRLGAEGESVTEDSLAAISESIADFKSDTTDEIDTQTEEWLVIATDLLADVKGLTAEEQASILDSIVQNGEDQKTAITDASAQIQAIYQTAADEHRELTATEWAQVLELQQTMSTQTTDIYKTSQDENIAILNSIYNETTRITSAQAEEIVASAQEAYDGVIASAESNYIDQVGYADKLKDELGVITQEQYDAILDAAEEEKEDNISVAAEKFTEVLELTQTGLKEQLDAETEYKDTVLADQEEFNSQFLGSYEENYEDIQTKANELWSDMSTQEKEELQSRAERLSSNDEETAQYVNDYLYNLAADSLGVSNITKEQFDAIQAGFEEQLAQVSEDTSTAYDNIQSAIDTAAGNIKTSSETYTSNLTDPYRALPDSMKSFMEAATTSASDTIESTDSLNKASDAGEAYSSALTDSMEWLPDDMAEIGDDAIDGFTESIEDGIDRARYLGEQLGDALSGGLSDSLDIESPSVVMSNIGEMANAGLIEGLEGTQSYVYDVASASGKAMSGGIVNGYESSNSYDYSATNHNDVKLNVNYANRKMTAAEEWRTQKQLLENVYSLIA